MAVMSRKKGDLAGKRKDTFLLHLLETVIVFFVTNLEHCAFSRVTTGIPDLFPPIYPTSTENEYPFCCPHTLQ